MDATTDGDDDGHADDDDDGDDDGDNDGDDADDDDADDANADDADDADDATHLLLFSQNRLSLTETGPNLLIHETLGSSLF